MLQQNKKSLLPKATQINKPIILVITGLLTFIILFAVLSAFTTSTTNKSKNTSAKINIEKPSDLNAAVADLPQNYQDIAALKKYSANTEDHNLTELQKEIEQLKKEHEMLEQQLSGLAHKRGGESNDQARTSNLFFNGVEPEKNVSLGKSTSDEGPGFGKGNAPGSADQHLQAGVAPLANDQAAYFKKLQSNNQKLAVMKAADNPEDIYDLHNVVTPASRYQVQAGTIIPATLITGINTTHAGTVVAQLTQNIYDSVTGKYLLLPKGSKALGEYDYRTSYGQQRVLLTFNRIIRPDGSSILISKLSAADQFGHSGIEGDVDNHWGRVLGAATLSTVLSIGAGVAGDYTNNGYYPDARQRSYMGAAGGINQVGQSITNRALDIQPTITLPAGYHFNIVVKKDMVINPPYKAQ